MIGVTLRALTTVVLAAMAATAPPAAAAPPAAGELVKPALFAESESVAVGATLWLDVHLAISSGWHIYWRNPGDSGLPTTIEWTLPPGFAAGDIAWPPPERFVVGPIGSYGYAGETDLLVPVTTPAAIDSATPVHLAATVNYLVCSEICIPGSAKLATDLPAGAGAADPRQAARFAAARQRLPVPAPFAAAFAVEPNALRLIVPAAALAGLAQPEAAFFPYADNVVDASAAPRTVRRNGGMDLVLAKSASPVAALPRTLDGVLVLRDSRAVRAYRIGATPTAAPALPPDAALGWAAALGFAFLGGLILNLMPCVFPVLSLKLLGFAGLGDSARRHRHGLAYTAGVLASFAALGGVLIALRAGGAALGWGFQLQAPPVVAALAYLMLAMGLGLSGVAEFGMGLAGTGSRFAAHGGLAGAFLTGVLASVVAAPCTAPFMGAALGAALVAPAPLALAIFVTLGAGLAAPLLAASLVPGLARVLPRPGRWMGLLKQLLAFPLYATAAWLVWVLVQEVTPAAALAALLGLVLVGFAVWVYGRTRAAANRGRGAGSALAAAGLAGAVLIAALLPAATGRSPTSADGLAYEAFTPSRLAALSAEHKRVFVNLTAAWCLTCIVNERATLDRPAVRDAFAAHQVVALKGDWTRQDPEIARFLEGFGRSGVPLYLLYDGSGTPTVLPQILTEAEVIGAVSRL
ncbi:MAG: thioredoxin family protein [Alphaproteobacteria bacterium]|nr:thioredoxin family protein [Alphaproteobacteria bacterium]